MLKPPSKATLRRYGLSVDDWLSLAYSQNEECPICKRKLGDLPRVATDHEHCRGWKKLPSDKRAATVRGLLCFYDNHRVVGRLTLTQARAVADYLEAYLQRKAKK